MARLGIRAKARRADLDRGVLHSLYIDSRLTRAEIAAKLSVTSGRVKRELSRYGIRRPPSQEHLNSLHNRSAIVRLYITRRMPQWKAASELGITLKTFRKLLAHYGITHRNHRGSPRFEIESKELRRLYVDERRTTAAIAKIFGCSLKTIRGRLQKLGIPLERGRRDPSITTVQAVPKLPRGDEITDPNNGSRTSGKKLPDKKTLARLYAERRLTIAAIATQYGATGQAVRYGLDRAGIERIPRRVKIDRDVLLSLYVESRLSCKEIAKELKVPASQVEKEIRRHKIRSPLTLDRLASLHSRAEVERIYVTEGLTQGEAAATLGTTIIMFRALLARYGITYRRPPKVPKFDIPAEDLRRLYEDELRTLSAIAQIYGCSVDTVKDRLKKLGILLGGYRRDPK